MPWTFFDKLGQKRATSNNTSGLSGLELAYNETITNTNITSTTEAGANTLVTASAVTFDGSPVIIEFGCLGIQLPAGLVGLNLWLFQDGTSIGEIASATNPSSAGPMLVPFNPKRRMAPTAASHTYSVRGSIGAGTGVAIAGGGGLGVGMPSFIRITRV